MIVPQYAELWCLSNFSFLRGASQAEELVERAHALGYSALAITDECSMAGIVRAHVAAKTAGLKLLIGAQFEVQGAIPFTLVALAQNLNGYGNLCEFITGLRRTSEKGTYHLTFEHLNAHRLEECLILIAPRRGSTPSQLAALAQWLTSAFPGRCWPRRAA
jgi:error-prone DNA polymerase